MQAESDTDGFSVVLIPSSAKAIIGARARERRVALNQTPTETARLLGVTPQTLRRWENGGVSDRMWQYKLNAWADVLKSSCEYLLHDVEIVIEKETRKSPRYAAERAPNGFILTPSQRIQIGEHAAARRRCLGLSFAQIAAALGTPWQTVQNWEAGKMPRFASASSFCAWEKALCVPDGWLLHSLESPTAQPQNSTTEIQLCADDFSDAVREMAIVLAKPAFDPFWQSTPLDPKQSRSASLFASRFGKAQNTLADLGEAAARFQISPRRAAQLVDVMCVRARRYVFLMSGGADRDPVATQFTVHAEAGIATTAARSASR
jgi:transcriptional regulator with XRE-family HTH domain